MLSSHPFYLDSQQTKVQFVLSALGSLTSYKMAFSPEKNGKKFKCRLILNNGGIEENRRFVLKPAVFENMEFFREKIRWFYPQLVDQNFNVSYNGMLFIELNTHFLIGFFY